MGESIHAEIGQNYPLSVENLTVEDPNNNRNIPLPIIIANGEGYFEPKGKTGEKTLYMECAVPTLLKSIRSAQKPAEMTNNQPKCGFYWVVVQKSKKSPNGSKFLSKKANGNNFLLAFTTREKACDFLRSYKKNRGKLPGNHTAVRIKMIPLSQIFQGAYSDFGDWQKIALDSYYRLDKAIGTIEPKEVISLDWFLVQHVEVIRNLNRPSVQDPSKQKKEMPENVDTVTDIWSRDPEVQRTTHRENNNGACPPIDFSQDLDRFSKDSCDDIFFEFVIEERPI